MATERACVWRPDIIYCENDVNSDQIAPDLKGAVDMGVNETRAALGMRQL